MPVYLLDCDLPENTEWDRKLTDYLYGGDAWYRLCQETVLGIGGVRMLRALGYNSLTRFHMNEGHASLLTVELLYERARKAQRKLIDAEDIEAVRKQCIFTTHTPVPAGHDQFPVDMVRRLMGEAEFRLDVSNVLVASLRNHVFRRADGNGGVEGPLRSGDMLNMTYLALNLSHYVNGVAKKHAEVSRHMFAEYQVDAITNGVHAATWTSPAFQALFDRHIPGWREDNFSLRYALGIAVARSVASPLRRQARAGSVREPRDECRSGRGRADARFRAAGGDLQARRPAVPRPEPVARHRGQGRPPANHLRRQGPSAGPGGQATDPADLPGAGCAQE